MSNKNRRTSDIFSLSFLDIIACGFGAIVLLILIVKIGYPGSHESMSDDSLLKELFTLQDAKEPLDIKLSKLKKESADLSLVTKNESDKNNILQDELKKVRKEQFVINKIKERLTGSQQSITEEMRRLLESQERDIEVGGIPVDSEYVIFLIDNSGSMTAAWDRVITEMDNILNIHPEVKGFNVMNDQGIYLITGYAKKWMKDSPSLRKNVLDLLKTQTNLGYSLSNPIKGIKTAINSHYVKGTKISLYVFGDEIRTESIDLVLNEIDEINKVPLKNTRKFRIHGVGFETGSDPVRFAHFMRQLSKRNEGTFLALSK